MLSSSTIVSLSAEEKRLLLLSVHPLCCLSTSVEGRRLPLSCPHYCLTLNTEERKTAAIDVMALALTAEGRLLLPSALRSTVSD